MKKITVTTNNIALVFKNGVLKRVLKEGNYWLGFGEVVEVYDMGKAFFIKTDIDVLLQNIDFASAVTIIEVMDNEIALVYQNQNFKNILSAGRYVYWNGINQYSFVKTPCMEY